jgi:ribosomal protein L14
MVQQESRLKVADNTEKEVLTIRVLEVPKEGIGDKIVVSIRYNPNGSVKKELFQLQLLYVPEKK